MEFFVGNLILNNFYLNVFLIQSVFLAAFSPKQTFSPFLYISVLGRCIRTPLENENTDLGLKLLQNSFFSIFFPERVWKMRSFAKNRISYDNLFMFVIFQKKILVLKNSIKILNSKIHNLK